MEDSATQALDNLLAHIVRHFADEEALIEKHRYAGIERVAPALGRCTRTRTTSIRWPTAELALRRPASSVARDY